MEQNDIKKSMNAMSHILYFYLSDKKLYIGEKLKNRIVNMLNIESTD